MLVNYFKIAWRNLWRNKAISTINIVGLALGMASAVLLLLNIQHELSVDQFHAKKAYIYKAYNKAIVNGKVECWNVTSPPLAPALKEAYGDVKNVARVSGTEKLLSYGDKKLKVAGNFTDAAFLNMFSFPLVRGTVGTALADIHSIVITESLAKKLFGDEDPVNKIIRADNADNFTVTGVLKDLPNNTEFRFEYLLPWRFLTAKSIEHAAWDYNYVSTFVELQPTAAISAVNKKIHDVITRHSTNQEKIEIFLYPLTREHLYGRFTNGIPTGGNIENVRFLAILASVILLIACINFMNLSTARSEKRAKEVGIRKVVGAVKRSLIAQFIGESILLAFVAGIVAALLVQLALPVFGSLANAPVAVAYQSPRFWLLALCFITGTGILAGSYPAFYLSSFKPVQVLKGVLKNGNALVTPRKILVVLQFVFAFVLINFTIIFQKQIQHVQNRSLGFIKENLIFHPLTDDLRKNYALVENELLNTGTAVALCESNTPITRSAGAVSGLEWQGQDPKANVSFELVTTSGDFSTTNGLKLIAGRDIDVTAFPTDTASCVINKTAANVTGFKDPIGQMIGGWKVVGVVNDFLIGDPTQLIKPTLIAGSTHGDFISIRLNPDKPPVQNIKTAEAILKKYNPGFLTEYQFADEDLAARFRQKEKVAVLMNSFSAIAIFIACMGLFGLSIYVAENRTKEIGIRKVLGASVAGITSLLAKAFLKLVVLAIVVAAPLAWLLMNFFLQNFEYRASLSFWIIPAAGVAVVLIAFLTISFQSVKAALANPVKSLHIE